MPAAIKFTASFEAVIDEAKAIVTSRDSEGRNASTSVEDQFTPSGSETPSIFIIEIIEMKLKRAKSYHAAGNWPKFKEELQDCINYSAFPIVLEDQPGGYYLRGAWEQLEHKRPLPPGGFGPVFREPVRTAIQVLAEEVGKS